MIAELASMVEPIVKTLTVGADASEAFRFFTGRIGSWWPVGNAKYSGDGAADVTLEDRVGGRLFATFKDGEERTWGIVKEFKPGECVTIAWGAPISQPGEKNNVTEVKVEFDDHGDGTCTVKLTHSDWDRLAENAQETRDDYFEGWDYVLGECFRDYMAKA
jgi:uncharacterized protein YndB with AHSA1/START domain